MQHCVWRVIQRLAAYRVPANQPQSTKFGSQSVNNSQRADKHYETINGNI
jgi:hypothetical protein